MILIGIRGVNADGMTSKDFVRQILDKHVFLLQHASITQDTNEKGPSEIIITLKPTDEALTLKEVFLDDL